MRPRLAVKNSSNAPGHECSRKMPGDLKLFVVDTGPFITLAVAQSLESCTRTKKTRFVRGLMKRPATAGSGFPRRTVVFEVEDAGDERVEGSEESFRSVACQERDAGGGERESPDVAGGLRRQG